MNLLAWWNLIFELPFLLALIYILLLATGTVTAEHDAEADVDHDVGLEHDMDSGSDLDHGIEHTVGHEHSLESGHSEPGTFFKTLSFLGIGKVPVSIVIVCFLLVWSFTGWATNQFLQDELNPILLTVFSGVIATVVAVTLTRMLAHGLARLLPSTETYGVSYEALIGRPGEVRYLITPLGGVVQVYDRYGNFHEVDCRTDEGELEVPPGTRVFLSGYDRERRVYSVVPESQIGHRLDQ